MDATANMICLDDSEDEVLTGGRADHTLPFIPKIQEDKYKAQTHLSSLCMKILTLYSQFMSNMQHNKASCEINLFGSVFL